MRDAIISLVGTATMMPFILAYVAGTFDQQINRVIVRCYRSVRRAQRQHSREQLLAQMRAEFVANRKEAMSE